MKKDNKTAIVVLIMGIILIALAIILRDNILTMVVLAGVGIYFAYCGVREITKPKKNFKRARR